MTTLDELWKRTNSILLPLHHESRTGAMRHWTASSAGTYGTTMALQAQFHISRYTDLSIGATERLVRVWTH
jgi:hypothetical protein